MKTVPLVAGLLLVSVLPVRPAPTNFPPASVVSTNREAVEVLRYDWFDSKRSRPVPVKIYYSKASPGSLPVILFSHGLGGSREGYEYLGRYWAAHGYASVHLQHLGSDASVWQEKPLTELKGNLRQAAAKPDNAVNRPLDVSFAIDQLEALNREAGPLKGRLDLAHIGVAGHSFGAFTALAVAGQVFVLPGDREISYADPRVQAAIAMSAPVPARKNLFDRSFARIKIPVLHMTGTEDYSPIGETLPAERRVAYDHIRGAEQFLLTLNGGDHSVFSGVAPKVSPEREQRFKALICESSTAFWDACLRGDAPAGARLRNDFKSVLGADGQFEMKSPK